MTLSRPMFPPRTGAQNRSVSEQFSDRRPIPAAMPRPAMTLPAPIEPPPIDPAPAGRRLKRLTIALPLDPVATPSGADRATLSWPSFLLSLAALLPVAAVAAMPAPVAHPPTAPKIAESEDLLQLAGRLDTAEHDLAVAVIRRTEATIIADQPWPAMPASIIWDLSQEVPDSCGAHAERDIDDETVHFFGNVAPAWRVADVNHLKRFVERAVRKTRKYRAVRAALAVASQYEDARAETIASSDRGAASDAIKSAARSIAEVAELIQKCEARMHQGLASKARAKVAVNGTEPFDHYAAGRAKLLHAETLARGVQARQGGLAA